MPLAETKYYTESVAIANILSNDTIVKQADISEVVSSIVSTVTNYVSGKIDPNNKAASIFNILAPGMLIALGGIFKPLGWLLELAELFHFEPSKMLGDIVGGIKESVMSGQQISSEQVDAAANRAVANNYGSAPTEEDFRKITTSLSLREIQIYKLSLDHTIKELHQGKLEKKAQVPLFLKFLGLKPVTASILSKVLSWIIKTVLISGGFMAAGALWEHMTGNGSKPGAPSATAPGTATPTAAVQQLFKVDPGYNDEKLNVSSGWIEGVPPSQIENQLVSWAQEIYPELRGKESFIRSSQLLPQVAQFIQQYNSNNTSNVTFMPKRFTSRKQIVDMFMDELAAKAQTLAQSNKTEASP